MIFFEFLWHHRVQNELVGNTSFNFLNHDFFDSNMNDVIGLKKFEKNKYRFFHSYFYCAYFKHENFVVWIKNKYHEDVDVPLPSQKNNNKITKCTNTIFFKQLRHKRQSHILENFCGSKFFSEFQKFWFRLDQTLWQCTINNAI